MLYITMQLDISGRLTLQVTTIICHHMKKVLLRKRYIGRLYIFIKNSKNKLDEILIKFIN